MINKTIQFRMREKYQRNQAMQQQIADLAHMTIKKFYKISNTFLNVTLIADHWYPPKNWAKIKILVHVRAISHPQILIL